MKKYEMMFIIPSKYTEGEVEEQIKKVNSHAEGAGATLGETHNLGKRRLSYPIEGQRNGTYVLTYFESEPETIAKMDLTIRLSDDVLRHMVVERNPHITQMPNLIEIGDREAEENRERRPMGGDRRPVRTPAKPAKPDNVNMKELDKKLDEILTEEVL